MFQMGSAPLQDVFQMGHEAVTLLQVWMFNHDTFFQLPSSDSQGFISQGQFTVQPLSYYYDFQCFNPNASSRKID